MIESELPDTMLVQVNRQVRSDFIGSMLRWMKCLFKDCDTEDALKDHESYERKRKEEEKL